MSEGDNIRSTAHGTSTLVRARFGPGMLLQHEDLEQLSTYTRELSRLLFRSFFGCGVVCGLKVEMDEVCRQTGIKVSPGVALDCSGDPVHLPEEKKLVLDKSCTGDLRGPFWVLLCGTTKCCSPRASVCASDDDESKPACTRERDGYEIRIVEVIDPKTACGCFGEKPEKAFVSDCLCVDPTDPCYVSHYADECGCDTKECGCDGGCIVLARIEQREVNGKSEWFANHAVRRFIRPVLMSDPLTRPTPKTPSATDPEEQEPGSSTDTPTPGQTGGTGDTGGGVVFQEQSPAVAALVPPKKKPRR